MTVGYIYFFLSGPQKLSRTRNVCESAGQGYSEQILNPDPQVSTASQFCAPIGRYVPCVADTVSFALSCVLAQDLAWERRADRQPTTAAGTQHVCDPAGCVAARCCTSSGK